MINAYNDIIFGVKFDIVHKYKISNAPDIILTVKLWKECQDDNLFGFCFSLAHMMVNPIVIEEMIQLVKLFKTKNEIINEFNKLKFKWNNNEFNTGAKMVSSDYALFGGLEMTESFLQNIQLIQLLSNTVENWLNENMDIFEDDFIENIKKLNIPGFNNNYWFLHFCRSVSYIKEYKNENIISSTKYLDMIGVKLFQDKYGLTSENIIELYSKINTKLSINYGDFACLCCETHRMINELEKFNYKFENKIEINKWLQFKKNYLQKNELSIATKESARSNVAILICFIDQNK
jgi:hypothetical protein